MEILNHEKLRAKFLSLIALQLAYDDMGVYPQSISGEGGYEKRTEKMEGYNQYGREILQKQCAIVNWMKRIPEQYKRDVEDLILSGVIDLIDDLDGVGMWTDSSDLFGWGYSNADPVSFNEIPDLVQAIKECPRFGGILFVCRRSKLRPQKPYYKYFSDEEKALFDACGDQYGWE